jgi:hypothetical protein
MAVPGLDPGIVPAIDALLAEARKKDVDARDNPRIKSGDRHDGGEVIRSPGSRASWLPAS